MKKTKNIFEILYNTLIGLWTPFFIMLIFSFISESSEGYADGEINIILAFVTFIVYLVLVMSNKIVFFNKN